MISTSLWSTDPAEFLASLASALAYPHSPAIVSSWPQHLCTIARQEDFSWLTNQSFKSKCTFLRAFFSPQLNILLPVHLVVTVTFSSMSLRHCAIKRIFLCPPGPPLSYPPPTLNASHFSNCRKEISSFFLHLYTCTPIQCLKYSCIPGT